LTIKEAFSRNHGAVLTAIMNQDDDWVLVSRDVNKPEPAYLRDISSYIDSIADSLWPVNKTIHDNPELGYEEYIAHDTLVQFMKSQGGWKVTPSAYGIETAWVAVHDSGRKGPVVSFNVEMGMKTWISLFDLRPY
jgi:hypothetical protein